MDKLQNTSSQQVIDKCKPHFARYGIPDILISDNGPQFSSELFKKFSNKYQFKHYTSSPHYPQSNGRAEKAVQSVKNLFKKANDVGTDPYLALLEHRNTPENEIIGSPAQRLIGRRTKSLIPATDTLLRPKTIKPNLVQQERKIQQTRQKYYYDRHTKSLQKLEIGDQVSIQRDGKWIPAVVTAVAQTPRSYILMTPAGQIYKRNRRHILKTQNMPRKHIQIDNDYDTSTTQPWNGSEVCPENNSTENTPVHTQSDNTNATQVRRSTRMIKKPDRYSSTCILTH